MTVQGTEIPAVSVLIPVYNAEKYLRECADSVVGQTLADLEILFVKFAVKVQIDF